MAKRSISDLGPVALAACLACAPLTARPCPFVGVVTRIDGLPQDVIITRIEGGKQTIVGRPRVLDPICQGDLIHTVGNTSILISLDGQGLVRVTRDLDYNVPAAGGAPTLAGNAYRALNDQVAPDMKRLPWTVRLKGRGNDFGFAVSALSAGGQQLQVGRRSLLVRLVGGAPPYRVEMRSPTGALVASQSDASHEIVLRDVVLSTGVYRITALDSAPNELSATVLVVDQGPPADTAYEGLADAEIRAAAASTALAQSKPGVWSFEAEQRIQAAPQRGLDRDRVYELIESYTAN